MARCGGKSTLEIRFRIGRPAAGVGRRARQNALQGRDDSSGGLARDEGGRRRRWQLEQLGGVLLEAGKQLCRAQGRDGAVAVVLPAPGGKHALCAREERPVGSRQAPPRGARPSERRFDAQNCRRGDGADELDAYALRADLRRFCSVFGPALRAPRRRRARSCHTSRIVAYYMLFFYFSY